MFQPMSSLLSAIHRIGPYILIVNMVLYFVELQYTQTRSSLDVGAWAGFIWIERVIAGFFTLEYIIRIRQAEHKGRYLFSSLGFIDVVSILPFWIGFYPGLSQEQLGLVRGARTLRLLKLFRYNQKLYEFVSAMYHSRTRFMPIVLITIMYLMISSTIIFEVERRAQPEVFQDYGDSLWWAVVTSTTVGYGDKFPITPIGQGFSILLMIIGIGIVGMVFGYFADAYNGEREPLDGMLMQTYCKAVQEEGVHGKTPTIFRQTHANDPQFLMFANTVDQYIEIKTEE